MKTTFDFRAFTTTVIVFLAGAMVSAAAVDDSIMTAAKHTRIFSEYFKGNTIQIKSENGYVTLKGSVSDEFNKSLAEETIAGIPGVAGVDNQLTITEKAPEANSDAWVTAHTKSALLFHRNANNIGVTTKDGIVTLHGTVINGDQKNQITEYVKDVDGVVDVDNELTIAATPEDLSKMPSDAIDDVSVNAQVKMALLAHRSTERLKTAVTTKDGVVTLTGTVKDQTEKDMVTRLVADISGVKGVNNMMAVPGSEKTTMN